MSLLVVLSLLAVAVVIMLAVPVDLRRQRNELEAEEWAEHDERP